MKKLRLLVRERSFLTVLEDALLSQDATKSVENLKAYVEEFAWRLEGEENRVEVCRRLADILNSRNEHLVIEQAVAIFKDTVKSVPQDDSFRVLKLLEPVRRTFLKAREGLQRQFLSLWLALADPMRLNAESDWFLSIFQMLVDHLDVFHWSSRISSLKLLSRSLQQPKCAIADDTLERIFSQRCVYVGWSVKNKPALVARVYNRTQ